MASLIGTSVPRDLMQPGFSSLAWCGSVGPAISRITASQIKQVVVTDTVPVDGEKKIDKIVMLSMAPLLGEAIRRIHTGQSVGEMFE